MLEKLRKTLRPATRTVYMRNDANSFNQRLPFDEAAFDAWWRRTVGTRPNGATHGDIRLPHMSVNGRRRRQLTARIALLEGLGWLLYRLRRLNSSWDFGRASGQCVCTLCGRQYLKHPYSEHRSCDDQPYLHRLCNGKLVKL